MSLRFIWKPLALSLVSISALAAGDATWQQGDGHWNDAAQWGGKRPGVNSVATIAGSSHVVLDKSRVALSRLDLALSAGQDATLTMNDGVLSAMEFVRLGEAPGSHGRFVLNGGRLCTTEIGVGGLNQGEAFDPPCRGEMEVRGGSLITRYLELGWQTGSVAQFTVVGSKAERIVTLNVFDCCIPSGKAGSQVELGFELDGGGVTPITYWNKKGSVHLTRSDRTCVCRLRLALLEAPCGGDVTLIRSNGSHCLGTFQNLPEGSPVQAMFAGITYEWKLTYAGGDSKADIVLTQPQVVDAQGGRTLYQKDSRQKPSPVNAAVIKEAWDELYAQADKTAPPLTGGTLAFPGAEGFGAHAQGGRGGKVLAVTNLKDSGPGSLRAAIETKGPRTVIFKVGGTIELKTKLVLREPFITIAGQTAPGDGICLKGAADTLTLINTHDVILRGLRVRTGRTGDKTANEGDSITCYSVDNFIIDHCSTSWGTDETLSCTENCDRYTIQWCIIAEGLNYYGHSMASLLGGDRSTWHHNLFAHCSSRNPRFCNACRCDFRNNVIYDWGATTAYGDFRSVNYVGNYLRPGASTTQKPHCFIAGDSVLMPGSLFIQGNVLTSLEAATHDNHAGVACGTEVFVDQPFAFPAVATQGAEQARDLVLAGAGATAPKRDAVDVRLADEVNKGTGKIIRTESDLPAAWPLYAGGTAPIESLEDGIPDEWKLAHALPLSDERTATLKTEEGYTNFEVYLHSLITPQAPLKLAGTLAHAATKPLVRIVLVGDSTVTDQAGWGVGFKELLADNVVCANCSAGGRSSKSFRSEGRWGPSLALKPDYVFIQFGHNDEPGKGASRETDPDTTFTANIARYVEETRKAGAKPVLVTSIARRRFDDAGKVIPGEPMTHYVSAVRKLAAEKQVPLLDLQTRTLELYARLGKEGCEQQISPVKKGEVDATHLNLTGSRMVGALVAEELRKAVPELKGALK